MARSTLPATQAGSQAQAPDCVLSVHGTPEGEIGGSSGRAVKFQATDCTCGCPAGFSLYLGGCEYAGRRYQRHRNHRL